MTLPLLILGLLLPAQEPEVFEPGTMVRVSTVKTRLQSRPLTFAKRLLWLKRGASLTVQKTKGVWLQVSHTDGDKKTVSGWVHKTAVMSAQKYDLTEATKKINPDNLHDTKGMPGGEAAAGKGWNSATEAKRRADSRKIDEAYESLDKLQKLVPRRLDAPLLEKLEAFRKAGKLGEFRK